MSLDRSKAPIRMTRLLAAALLLALNWHPCAAEDLQYLRIGTGPPGESLFSVGGAIAGAISAPPGSRPCGHGGSCGVPGLIADASVTAGSVADAQALEDGRIDAALLLADIARDAHEGLGPFAGRKLTDLKAAAMLYPAQIHLVARKGAFIAAPRDLAGKRVSLGENGSGTLVLARRLLAAYGLAESGLKTVETLPPALAASAMQAGKLDAFFVVDGWPVPAVTELARTTPIVLIPIAGKAAQKLRGGDELLHAATIPAGSYEGVITDVPTLEVGLELAVSSRLSDSLVAGILKALWTPEVLLGLKAGQPQAAHMSVDMADRDSGLPLHPGAEAFYRAARLKR